jgi:hypothetical protein
VADCDAEGQRAAVKDTPPFSAHVGDFLGGIDLNLVLEPRPAAVLVDHQRGDQQPGLHEPLGTEDDGHVPLRSGGGDCRPGAVQELRVGRRERPARRAIAGHVRLGKAHEVRAGGGGVADRAFGQDHRLVGRRGQWNVRQRQSKCRHGSVEGQGFNPILLSASEFREADGPLVTGAWW